ARRTPWDVASADSTRRDGATVAAGRLEDRPVAAQRDRLAVMRDGARHRAVGGGSGVRHLLALRRPAPGRGVARLGRAMGARVDAWARDRRPAAVPHRAPPLAALAAGVVAGDRSPRAPLASELHGAARGFEVPR